MTEKRYQPLTGAETLVRNQSLIEDVIARHEWITDTRISGNALRVLLYYKMLPYGAAVSQTWVAEELGMATTSTRLARSGERQYVVKPAGSFRTAKASLRRAGYLVEITGTYPEGSTDADGRPRAGQTWFELCFTTSSRIEVPDTESKIELETPSDGAPALLVQHLAGAEYTSNGWVNPRAYSAPRAAEKAGRGNSDRDQEAGRRNSDRETKPQVSPGRRFSDRHDSPVDNPEIPVAVSAPPLKEDRKDRKEGSREGNLIHPSVRTVREPAPGHEPAGVNPVPRRAVSPDRWGQPAAAPIVDAAAEPERLVPPSLPSGHAQLPLPPAESRDGIDARLQMIHPQLSLVVLEREIAGRVPIASLDLVTACADIVARAKGTKSWWPAYIAKSIVAQPERYAPRPATTAAPSATGLTGHSGRSAREAALAERAACHRGDHDWGPEIWPIEHRSHCQRSNCLTSRYPIDPEWAARIDDEQNTDRRSA